MGGEGRFYIWDSQLTELNGRNKKKKHNTCVCAELELGISPGGSVCGGEVVSDLGVLIPRAGWGEMGWMVGERMRLAVPRQSDWTASGALDWGFPHSAEGGVENGGGKRGKKKKRVGDRMGVVVSDPQHSD